MKDQTIYQEVAKLLYLEAPDVSSEVHALVRYFKESSMISVWVGELRSTAGGFALSYEAGTRVSDLVGELKAYYVEKIWGIGMLHISLRFLTLKNLNLSLIIVKSWKTVT
ncbi:hypothetical protein [Microbulbifer sp. PSTR4-B]|uniref:hypothetical protein n=1 Tax=Microbulbifer sp. PSTR4-B TaxID=3243396 RepID=UPI0040397194